MNDVLALPFDQYQRYRLVADLLRAVRRKGEKLRVLDVGGRTALLREFLPDAKVDLVDLEPSQAPGLVLGDGARLPFADDAYDAVLAFDTLEHVPPSLRRAFVDECARVARRWVVLAGPYAAPRVAEAEHALQRFLKEKLRVEHRYLDEHRHHGLPDRAAVETQLAGHGARVGAIGHGNLERWLALQCLSMYLDYDPALRGLAAAFQRFYNRALYDSDHAEPVYRHVVVAAFDGARLPEKSELLGPPVAPAGALAPFRELIAELAAFDREREAWREERDALFRAAFELRADLEGHRASLANLQRERDHAVRAAESVHAVLERERRGSLESIAALQRDLDGHRKAVAELERTLAEEQRAAEQARAAQERDLAAHRTALHEREADLDGHRQALAEAKRSESAARAAAAALAADLDGHRKGLAEAKRAETAARAAAAALAADLDGHRQALAESRRAEAEARAAAAALTADLEGHRAALAEQRALRAALERAAAEDRAALQRDVAGHRAAIAALTADLAGHRAAITALTADLEGHRTALADANATLASLRDELARERAARTDREAALARSDAALAKALALATGLEASLAKREEAYDRLHAEIASRWRNFARVFRPAR